MYVDSQFRGQVFKVLSNSVVVIEQIPQIRADTPSLGSIGCGDKISSLRCGPGTNVELFVDAQYKGASQRFNGDVPSLGKFNDKVRRTPPPD